ncbi:SDR family NAD(P)-dependent oxidoreductase [Amycolatopsis sp. cg5]|uniref:SDR family NAD(P)-dependent oxidoreductase n=1 Tax=Amycolatopsis sp. cg5 TaxID=3238802 RepID=UPI003525D838
MSLQGRKILVTGASTGIGAATAETLVNAGAVVVGTYRTGEPHPTRLVTAGVEVMIPVDFTDRPAVDAALSTVAEHGPFDGIVNNAGTFESETWDELTLQSWDRVLDVNLRAVLAVTKALTPSMASGGSIVNISSIEARIGSYSYISYSASKAALISLTRSLAVVLGSRGIRVNSISPGWIDTGLPAEDARDAIALTPLGRTGEPHDVADLIMFLLSDNASFITGANHVIDGGYTQVDAILNRELHGAWPTDR